ncbi:MAG: hypothetical protein JWL76_162 [Thermoleophilia bacterium]|nr:hypothetical protein [Thermoleophilia bacterium]
MITAAGIMKPLPVRPPLEGSRGTGMQAPLPRTRQGGSAMQPLPFPKPDVVDLADAIRNAAFQRMQQRTAR